MCFLPLETTRNWATNYIVNLCTQNKARKEMRIFHRNAKFIIIWWIIIFRCAFIGKKIIIGETVILFLFIKCMAIVLVVLFVSFPSLSLSRSLTLFVRNGFYFTFFYRVLTACWCWSIAYTCIFSIR